MKQKYGVNSIGIGCAVYLCSIKYFGRVICVRMPRLIRQAVMHCYFWLIDVHSANRSLPVAFVFRRNTFA